MVRAPTAFDKGVVGGLGLHHRFSLASLSRVVVRERRWSVRMSVRRRWRIGWVRRGLVSPAQRAIVLPRVRPAV